MKTPQENEDGDSPEFDNVNNVEEQRRIAKFIDEIVKNGVEREKEEKQNRVSDFDNLLAITSEWLDTFLIMGYDLDGNEVVISKVQNSKDNNALLNLLKCVFVDFVVKSDGGV